MTECLCGKPATKKYEYGDSVEYGNRRRGRPSVPVCEPCCKELSTGGPERKVRKRTVRVCTICFREFKAVSATMCSNTCKSLDYRAKARKKEAEYV